MRKLILPLALLMVTAAYSAAKAPVQDSGIIRFHGMSDASAAVAIDDETFVVADDENNVLRAYRIGAPNRPVHMFDISRFLQVDEEHPEADIEGAARLGDRVYWITSHGRNAAGKIRSSRYRFFATSINVDGDAVSIEPVGFPCLTLGEVLVKSESTRHLDLQRAMRLDAGRVPKKLRRALAPKQQGLNIEGLCAAPDNNTLYIGLRNPTYQVDAQSSGRAVVIALTNPDEVVEHRAAPILGATMLWDCDGLGIRSFVYSAFHNAYFVIAGRGNDEPDFRLYRWSGAREDAPTYTRRIRTNTDDFNPEALISVPGLPKLLMLSDDGAKPVPIAYPQECAQAQASGRLICPNKYLVDPNRKTFRASWLVP